MKRHHYLFTLIGAVLLLQSCGTTSKVSVHSATSVTEEEISLGVRVTPFLCDYEMIPKENPVAVYEEYNTGILVESIITEVDYWIIKYETIVKSKMMKKYGADAILSATSEAITNDKGELVITVRGYPIKYTNFRPASKDDIWMLNYDNSVNKSTVIKPIELIQK
jgi:hypothetical protein